MLGHDRGHRKQLEPNRCIFINVDIRRQDMSQEHTPPKDGVQVLQPSHSGGLEGQWLKCQQGPGPGLRTTGAFLTSF